MLKITVELDNEKITIKDKNLGNDSPANEVAMLMARMMIAMQYSHKTVEKMFSDEVDV